MDIAPFRGLRFALSRLSEFHGGERRSSGDVSRAVTSPPYDVISPEEHRELLERSPYNVTRLTLGTVPGEASSYEERGKLVDHWIESGVLEADDTPCFYAYEVDYPVPGAISGERAHMIGLVALGRLSPFEDGVVLPHERTFPKVVDDRKKLLEATRTNLESILLLFSEPERAVDRLLERATTGDPLVRVEAKRDEYHVIYPVRDAEAISQIVELMCPQKPIIADGHHRYTTSLNFFEEVSTAGGDVPGAGWQMMTFVNLYGEGLSILPTHRLVKLAKGDVSGAISCLRERLREAEGDDWDLAVETAHDVFRFRMPKTLRSTRSGAAGTNYAILHDVILAEWLAHWVGEGGQVAYYKEGTGEREALQSGRGDLLFRMRPVGRDEFQKVVEGGEVFPHKTTYFYPKLWSGLLLWQLEEPGETECRISNNEC